MNAIVTVTIGEKFERIAAVTHPTLRSYAERLGADFIVIDGKSPGQEDIVPHFAKLQIRNLFNTYDRILFLDTDVIVRADTPNLFEIVPEHKVGLFREGKFIPRRKLDIEMAAKTYCTKVRMNPDDWKGQYWNTGVLVASRIHKSLFEAPDFEKVRKVEGAWDYGEQGWINIQIINSSTPVHDLPYKFNRMTVMDDITGEDRHASYIIHYAGAPDVIPGVDGELTLPEFIFKDIAKWISAVPGGYKFKRHIYIRVGGGMGDQVDSEPVVRHIVEEAYKGEDIIVATDWTRIFSHLKVPCVKPMEVRPNPDTPYYKMETLPIPESMFGNFISHPLVHSTDYSALSCLRTMLPRDKKTIHLQTTLDDVTKLMDVVGSDLQNWALVHPGRGWKSKTFPSSWWQEVIDGMHKKGIPVCLIGKEVGDDQGLVPVNARKGMMDLRNKTDMGMLFTIISAAKVLVSNDSAPVHIAGAFDNYIILIPSCKHPDHVLPWRNGSQTYKAASLYKRLTVDDICNLPTEAHGQTIDWIKGGDIVPYLPEPESVVETAVSLYDKAGGMMKCPVAEVFA
jgi:hypothetical protein